VVFVDFDRLIAERAPYLAAIGSALGLRHTDSLVEQARILRAPTTPERAPAPIDETLQDARAVHAALRAAASAALPAGGVA
jgi:hypothetical protein